MVIPVQLRKIEVYRPADVTVEIFYHMGILKFFQLVCMQQRGVGKEFCHSLQIVQSQIS